MSIEHPEELGCIRLLAMMYTHCHLSVKVSYTIMILKLYVDGMLDIHKGKRRAVLEASLCITVLLNCDIRLYTHTHVHASRLLT